MDVSFLSAEVSNLQQILSKNMHPDAARKELLNSFCRIYSEQTGTSTSPDTIAGGPTSIAWGIFHNQFGNLSSMASIRACAGAIAGDLVRESDRMNMTGTGFGDTSVAQNVRDNLMTIVNDPDLIPGNAPTRVGRGVDADTLAQNPSANIFDLIRNMENTRVQAEAARQARYQAAQQAQAAPIPQASASQASASSTPSAPTSVVSDKAAGIGTLCAGALLVGGVPLLVGLAALHLIASSRTSVLDDSAKVVGSGTKIVASALLEAAGISGIDDVKQRLGGLASRLGLSRSTATPQQPQTPSGPKV